MARLHFLMQTSPNNYEVIVHAPTPGGNNSAGVAWATAIVNAGLASSSMPVGAGAGQITSAENTQVLAGTVIESRFVWTDDPSWTNPQRLADLETRATQAVQATLDDFGARLKQFGRTVT